MNKYHIIVQLYNIVLKLLLLFFMCWNISEYYFLTFIENHNIIVRNSMIINYWHVIAKIRIHINTFLGNATRIIV